jgi:hypothetical protein
MSRCSAWLAIAVLSVSGCFTDSLEGSRAAAEDGTRVQVMLVPIDEGASIGEGAGAFDDGVATTESLAELERGGGAFVVGVVDGYGIALVPEALTDDAADPDREVDPRDGDPARDLDGDDTTSCASDCAVWCTTTLDLCDGDGAATCDCSEIDNADPEGDASPDDGSGEGDGSDEYDGYDEYDDSDEQSSCTWSCDEWCVTTLDLCDGDGWELCDCGAGGGDEYDDGDVPACAWDCTEWCDGSLELCDGDGWELCADACAWSEARGLPPSASAGAWVTPVVVAGVALVIVLTDPEVQAALDRGESIGSAVGGTYGRRADMIMERLRQVRRDVGEITADAQRPCADLLARSGYRETLDTNAGETIRVGICMQDRLTVWPSRLTVRAGDQSSVSLSFSNLGSGLRTVLARDATVGWSSDGRNESVTVEEGSATRVTLPLNLSSRTYTVAVPRDGTSTPVTVNIVP